MKVLSVNISKLQVVEIDGKMVSTGIFKQSVDDPVTLRTLDFDGDAQSDLGVHGGLPPPRGQASPESAVCSLYGCCLD